MKRFHWFLTSLYATTFFSMVVSTERLLEPVPEEVKENYAELSYESVPEKTPSEQVIEPGSEKPQEEKSQQNKEFTPPPRPSSSKPTAVSRQKRCCSKPAPARISLRHIEPKGIGYRDGYTTIAGFFSPFWSRNVGSWVPFMDLRVHVFDDSRFASNAGLGLRYLSSCRAWGLNTYYDFRQTSRHNYNQISVGLESLGKILDFRINGYLPVGGKTSSSYHHQFGKFQGHRLWIRSLKEFAMKGANGEVGAHVDYWKTPLYFAGGPYYLSGEGKATWGGQLRGSIDFNVLRTTGHISLNQGFIRLEGNVSYDHLFKWIGQGQISLNMGLGGKRCSDGKKACRRGLMISRALQGVDRMEIIPTSTKHTSAKAINPVTGEPYFFWFVDNTSHSAGTYEDPFPSLFDAQMASSPNDVIYVFPGDGSTTNMNAGIMLQTNQRFWGSGVSHTLPTQFGGITIPAQTTSTPMMTNTGGNAITLASGNEVSGFEIPNPAGNGIFGTEAGSTTILSTTITGATNNGIFMTLSGNSDLIFKGLNISGSASDAIQLVVSGGVDVDMLVANSSLIANGNTGVNVINSTIGIFNQLVLYNRISDNVYDGVIFDTNTITTLNQEVSGNFIANNGFPAVDIFSNTIGVMDQKVLGNTILNNGAGVYFESNAIMELSQNVSGNSVLSNSAGVYFDTNTITELVQKISGNVISNSSFDNGIALYDNVISILNQQIIGNEVSNSVLDGIHFENNTITTANVNISGCEIEANGGSGISISSNPAMSLTVSDSTINSNSNQGINLTISGTSSETAANTFLASGNTVLGNLGGGIIVNLTNGNATTLTSVIENNNVSFNGVGGISLTAHGPVLPPQSVFVTTIQGNTTTANAGIGIDLALTGRSDLIAYVLDNTLAYNILLASPMQGFQANTVALSKICLDLENNSSDRGYYLKNAVGGTFNLAPTNAQDINIGTITEVGTITSQPSCP